MDKEIFCVNNEIIIDIFKNGVSLEELKLKKKQTKIKAIEEEKLLKEQEKQAKIKAIEEEKLLKEQEKQAKIKAEQYAKEAKIKADEEARLLKIKQDLEKEIKIRPFKIYDGDNNEYIVSSKQDIYNIYISKNNNNLYFKIKDNDEYKPYFLFYINIDENESDKRTEIIIKRSYTNYIKHISKLLELTPKQQENNLIITKLDNVYINSNLNGRQKQLSYKVVVKGFISMPIYLKEQLEKK